MNGVVFFAWLAHFFRLSLILPKFLSFSFYSHLLLIPGMAGILALATLSYLLVALVGVQLWAGIMGGKCSYKEPSSQEWAFTPALPTYDSCALSCSDFSGICTYAFGDRCGSIFAATINATWNSTITGNVSIPMTCAAGLAPSQGQAQFDNLGRALMMAFVMVTTEGWTS